MNINISDQFLNQCKMTEEKFKREIALLLFEARKINLENASNLAGIKQVDFKQLLKENNITLRSFKVIKLIYIVISLLVLLLGIGCDLYSKSLEPQPQTISVIKDGSIVEKNILSPQPISIITGIASIFCYGLSASIFIIIFIESEINRVQQKRQKEQLENFQESINQNIFKAIFETVVPKEIFTILIRDIIGNNFLRKNANWRYDFEVNNDELILTQRFSYELHNISSVTITNPLTINFARLSKHEESELIKASCIINGITYDYYDSKEPKQKKGVSINKSKKTSSPINNSDKDIESIDLKLTIPPETYADITTIIQTSFRNYRSDEVIDFFGTRYPIINGRLTVTFPLEYDFDIVSYLSTPFKKIEPSSTEREYVYEFKGGVLPYQGFLYSLQKKS